MPIIFTFVAVIMGAIGIYFLCVKEIMDGLAALLVAFNSLGYAFVLMEIKDLKSHN